MYDTTANELNYMKLEQVVAWLGYAVGFAGVSASLLIVILIKWKGDLTIKEPNEWILMLEFILFAFALLWLLNNTKRFT